MPEYVYQAMDQSGRMQEGLFMAETDTMVRQALRERGLVPIKITPKQAGSTKELFGRKTASADSLATFCRLLAMVLRAGMPMLRGLEVLQTQMGDALMKKECLRLYREVLTGHSLSEAMRGEGTKIPPLLARMVNTGEASGNLDTILRAMGEYYEQEYLVQKKIKGAMVYPVILLMVSIGMIAFVFKVLIPQIKGLLSSFGGELPWITKFVIGLGDTIASQGIYILGGIVGLVMLYSYFVSTPNGRLWRDRMRTKIPALGPVIQSTVTARFARTAGIVFRGGIPLLQGLDLIKQNVGSAVAELALDHAIEGVRKGETLADTLDIVKFFDPMAIQLIRVGEETGNMEELMDQMMAYYDREATNGIAQLLTLMEPIMLLIMGVVIGGAIVASILPLFNLLGSIGPGMGG